MMIERSNNVCIASCDASCVVVVDHQTRHALTTRVNHMSRRNRKAVVDASSAQQDNAPASNDNDVNAIDALNVVANDQNASSSNDTRDRDIARLLHALYNDESLTSHDKKAIRRTLRDTYNYYISRERKRVTSSIVSRILNDERAT